MNKTMWLAGALAVMTVVPQLAMAQAAAPAAAAKLGFEADRQDILAMAGNYKVRFDMQESTPWREGYTPLDRKLSGGNEVVRVIEDSGKRIVLQHLLVAEHGGQLMVIKHWRQDWIYEPAEVLVYTGPDQWKMEAIPADRREGRWSQTVWQVDDSPRYGSYGRWYTEGGVRRWRSDWTLRPLARRDAIRNPVYDRYMGINRHQSFPGGWVHWQDNTKLGAATPGAQPTPVVQEYVLNTYSKSDDFDVKAADDYWAATKDYWQAVRGMWDAVLKRDGGIRVKEEAQTGTVISGRLLEIADAVQKKSMTQAAAIAEARTLIERATKAAS